MSNTALSFVMKSTNIIDLLALVFSISFCPQPSSTSICNLFESRLYVSVIVLRTWDRLNYKAYIVRLMAYTLVEIVNKCEDKYSPECVMSHEWVMSRMNASRHIVDTSWSHVTWSWQTFLWAHSYGHIRLYICLSVSYEQIGMYSCATISKGCTHNRYSLRLQKIHARRQRLRTLQ